MRKLTEQELDQVKKAIAAKELTSAEILIEIYDHYVSHLESFEEMDFEEQLFELEGKFTPNYCKTLQLNFYETAEKELNRLQWSIWKSYFTWPRAMWTIFFFIIFFYIWINGGAFSRTLALSFPFISGFSLNGWLWYKSYKKVNEIRKLVKSHTTLQSSYLPNSVTQFAIMFGVFNLLFNIPRTLNLLNSMESIFSIIAILLIYGLFISYMLSFYEACKLKSKIALI
ncbi:hypothetical protein [Algoriphagus antarcticus]|uniref:Uncharacterized protein n=1 Tax=Algoriphagus antarcticus TaxID=238540 RepID=A0A3E0DG07_9BACT|nr:hypothetical protein [Algoriphagus antarcticus]REG81519.1 hypothetical protein C8N25_12623 [Algoriphagus antarcticus]